MTDHLTLRVLTQAGLALEDEAVSVIAPGELGYLGMLLNHAPLVTTLKPGKLTWRRASGELPLQWIGSGLLEIMRNQITILTETVSVPQQGASHDPTTWLRLPQAAPAPSPPRAMSSLGQERDPAGPSQVVG